VLERVVDGREHLAAVEHTARTRLPAVYAQSERAGACVGETRADPLVTNAALSPKPYTLTGACVGKTRADPLATNAALSPKPYTLTGACVGKTREKTTSLEQTHPSRRVWRREKMEKQDLLPIELFTNLSIVIGTRDAGPLLPIEHTFAPTDQGEEIGVCVCARACVRVAGRGGCMAFRWARPGI